jgi:hypothetical protein
MGIPQMTVGHQRLHAVIAFTNNSFEFARDRWHNKGSTHFQPMQRYSINSPLVAIRLCPSGKSNKAGVVSSLPSQAIIETLGPSDLGTGMIEVSWQHQRFAVFERDLKVRGSLVRTAAVGD